MTIAVTPRDILIRSESASDHAAIGELTTLAFASAAHSEGTEALIIDRLRALGALAVSLVAVREGEIVGHVAFSPSQVSGQASGWFALGPVSVKPGLQRCGIGKALIWAGLDLLKQQGAGGCILVGDPAYYGRFGFRLSPEHCPAGLPPEYFMILSFGGEPPAGGLGFHPAFFGPAGD